MPRHFRGALQKLENVVNKHFGLLKWEFDNVRKQLCFKHINL
ncbi:hypothetical protein N752_00930 [Desulforamulus aquiferis]|nr:hypothetical protein N752_00930 [Desulforamulus aquiferis]